MHLTTPNVRRLFRLVAARCENTLDRPIAHTEDRIVTTAIMHFACTWKFCATNTATSLRETIEQKSCVSALAKVPTSMIFAMSEIRENCTIAIIVGVTVVAGDRFGHQLRTTLPISEFGRNYLYVTGGRRNEEKWNRIATRVYIDAVHRATLQRARVRS